MGIAVAAPTQARALSRQRSQRAVVALAIVLMIPAAITAYYRVFMGIKPYDDEGTLIEMVRSFLAGHPLFDSVPSFYGPTFFLYQWVAHALVGAPITTDSVRFVSLAFWIGCDLLVFALVYRATQSWMMAAGAFLLAFRALNFIGIDPAHPQELCLFLLLALAVVGCGRGDSTGKMLWLGVLAGTMAMTKINMGALMVVAVGLVLLHATRWPAARVAGTVGALVFVWLLMSPLMAMSWTQRYFVVVELSLAAVAVAIARTRFDVRIGIRELAIAAVGFLGAVAAFAMFAMAFGSSLGAMIEMLIVRPRASIGPGWFWAPKIGSEMMWWGGAGLVAAVIAQTRLVRPWMIVTLKLVLGLGITVLMSVHRVNDVLTAIPPFLWLVTMTEDEAARARVGGFGRALLAAAGVLIVLYAYPVAGDAQTNFVAVFLIAVAAVAFADGAWWVAARLGGFRIWAQRAAYAATALILFRFCVVVPLQARQYYEDLPSLGLPGAQRLHLYEDEVAGLRGIAEMARDSCGMLLTVPGMPTFNLWTGLPAPKGLGGGNWVTGLNDAAQEKVVREIAGVPKLWTHRADVSGRPLIRFVQENFRPVAEGRGNVLMVRR